MRCRGRRIAWQYLRNRILLRSMRIDDASEEGKAAGYKLPVPREFQLDDGATKLIPTSLMKRTFSPTAKIQCTGAGGIITHVRGQSVFGRRRSRCNRMQTNRLLRPAQKRTGRSAPTCATAGIFWGNKLFVRTRARGRGKPGARGNLQIHRGWNSRYRNIPPSRRAPFSPTASGECRH
jgi:hypothetical protein